MIKTQHCPNCEAQAAEIERLRVEAKAQFDRGYYDGITRPLEQSDAPKNTPIWTEATTIQTNGRWDGNTAQSDALADLSDDVLAPIVEAMGGNELSYDCDVEGLRRVYKAILATLQEQSK